MDLESQFKALQVEYRINPYPALQERKHILSSLKKALQNNAYLLAEAINKDFSHRSIDETLFLEIFPTIKSINFCLKKMKHWMKKRPRNVSWLFIPAYAYVFPQPVGVVGNLVPWNYPIYLSLVPAIYALAAGNRVMIKMSELSVHTGLALQQLIQSLGLGHFITISTGDINVSKAFASLPFGHLIFTGSTAVGKSVMSSASAHLTPITLELGGKSPATLSSTMNSNHFKRLFMGKLYNAAQTCIAPDYLLIPMGWRDKIETEFRQFMSHYYPDLMDNNQYSSVINSQHKERLTALIDDAIQKGAQVVCYGEPAADGNKMPVYLLFDVTYDMRVMQEELFGPVLPVITYRTFADVAGLINLLPNPLALYYFGTDKEEIIFIRNNILSGALTINDTIMHIAIDDLPFGGIGQSGMGHYHSQEGFDAFSKLKPVMVQRKFSPISLLYPPYGRLMRFFLRWIGGIKIKK